MAHATIGVSVPHTMAEEVEQYVENSDYESVSQFGREAMRNQMQADMGEATDDSERGETA